MTEYVAAGEMVEGAKNFIVDGGHTGRHEANVAYSRIRTIGKIKVQFRMYDDNHELFGTNSEILIG